MLHTRPVRQLAGAIMGFALCVSSGAAAAAPLAPSLSPLVALSAFGTPASASAVRPSVPMPSAATLPMSAAAVQGGVDPSDPPLLFVLLGLAGFVALAALLLHDDDDGDIELPGISPD